MIPVQKTLSNGLRVLLVDTKSFPSLTSILLVGVGSRYENAVNSGISHFLEHMPFKGTKNYPSTQIIASLTDGFGGIFNAFTSKDHTAYWIKAPSRHFGDAVGIISDLARFPLLQEEEIEREKGVIVEEINMYEDTPSNKVEEIYEQLVYKGNPLGRDIIGTKDTVTAFTKKTFTEFHDQHYFANNCVFVVAGGFELSEDAMIAIIEEKFGDWESGKKIDFEKFDPHQTSPNQSIFEKKSEQAHLVLGYRTFGNTDKRKYALSVLSAIMGGGMSSRLFMQVRERRGLCYYIHTSPSLYADSGTLATSAGVPIDPKKIQEAVDVIRDEQAKLVSKGIEKEEFIRVKEMIKGRSILAFEDSRALAVAYGTRLLLQNEIVTLEQYLQNIEGVTMEEVNELSKIILTPENENFALLAPKGI